MFENVHVAILGIGKSGVALARELTARGAIVLLSDNREAEQLQEPLAQLAELGVTVETGGHTEAVLRNELLIISPGVSIHSPLVEKALSRGLQVLGEVEVAWRLSPAPFIAVTGTNGKSTTVTLIDRMLGKRSVLAGNIGNPLVAEVSSAPPEGYVVAEISSFQLESVYSFRPKIAILTNVTPDHLDRHPNLEEYFAAKARLFAQQGPEDVAIFSADDPQALRMARLLQEKRLPPWLSAYPAPSRPAEPEIMYFSLNGPVENGTWFENGWVYFRHHGVTEKVLAWDFPGLPGPHNLANGLAAILVAKLLGVPTQDMQQALSVHRPLHFRMELVRTLDGVQYVNDSKGTNPGSVIAALETYQAPVFLIAGGKDKGFDFSLMAPAIKKHCKLLVLIGEASERFARELRATGFENILRCGSLQEAVLACRSRARAGEAVLLSPACSSFDMFRNAEERGAKFVQYVNELR